MLLRVKNLGPVREAELDLGKPLIVLTGPNNSGKTYLTWAAYSLARLTAAKVEIPTSLAALIDRLPDGSSQAMDIGDLLAVSDDVLRATAEALRNQLPDDFAAPRTRFEHTRFEVVTHAERKFSGPSGGYLYPHEFENGGWSYHAFHVDGNQIRFDIGQGNARRILASGLISLVHLVSLDRAYVPFPVERIAINLFARELAARRTDLVDELLSNAADALAPTVVLRDKLQQRARRYPLVIRDALQTAIRLAAKADVGPFADLAHELEVSVLGGRIEIDAHDDLRFIPSQDPAKVPLDLHESASVVKSLASLVLCLRNDALSGQRLVIDEPELNLHPDNQRRIARILAKAVNRGLKIMMSTHSDYVIRELNNLVMLGQDSEKARALAQELGYQPEQTLQREQIGAYLVSEGACTSLEVTETGFETKTIEDEIHKLNQDAQRIYLRLFSE